MDVQIKWTNYIKTMKKALNAKTVNVKENQLWAQPKYQSPDHKLAFYVSVVILSETWPTDVQLKRKP